MKKLIALFAVFSIMAFGMTSMSWAAKADGAEKKATEETTTTEAPAATETAAAPQGENDHQAQINTANDNKTSADKNLHTVLKEKFADGGPGWMATVLICLIIGIAFAIERIFYLNLASVNSKKLIEKVDKALEEGGVEKAKDVCRNERGPLAGVFCQGLERYEEGLDSVEKSIVSYGGVEMGKLEKNLSWIGLCMALGPMLGFMGTVVGMVQAFDDIEKQGDISPTIVAGGMKVALLTTVFGLITAIILQIFYNYILSKIDAIVNDMERATIEFMDIMIKNKNK